MEEPPAAVPAMSQQVEHVARLSVDALLPPQEAPRQAAGCLPPPPPPPTPPPPPVKKNEVFRRRTHVVERGCPPGVIFQELIASCSPDHVNDFEYHELDSFTGWSTAQSIALLIPLGRHVSCRLFAEDGTYSKFAKQIAKHRCMYSRMWRRF